MAQASQIRASPDRALAKITKAADRDRQHGSYPVNAG